MHIIVQDQDGQNNNIINTTECLFLDGSIWIILTVIDLIGKRTYIL